jgi:hypothetical protein
MTWRSLIARALLAGIVLSTGCAESSSPPVSPDPTAEPVKFLFGMADDATGDEDFVALTAEPSVIAAARAELRKDLGSRTLHIDGPIARGDAGENLGWHWHHKPGEWNLAEVSVESCDGRPGFVEGDLDYWVDQVGRFCPWGSRVLAELPG